MVVRREEGKGFEVVHIVELESVEGEKEVRDELVGCSIGFGKIKRTISTEIFQKVSESDLAFYIWTANSFVFDGKILANKKQYVFW